MAAWDSSVQRSSHFWSLEATDGAQEGTGEDAEYPERAEKPRGTFAVPSSSHSCILLPCLHLLHSVPSSAKVGTATWSTTSSGLWGAKRCQGAADQLSQCPGAPEPVASWQGDWTTGMRGRANPYRKETAYKIGLSSLARELLLPESGFRVCWRGPLARPRVLLGCTLAAGTLLSPKSEVPAVPGAAAERVTAQRAHAIDGRSLAAGARQ